MSFKNERDARFARATLGHLSSFAWKENPAIQPVSGYPVSSLLPV
jgi:hypothetical protein